MHISELDTPALIVDLDRLEKNIAEMAEFARTQRVALRPHVKTHKSPDIARRQIAAGAVGLTVAKIGEAEVFADHGITDLFIAYPVVGEQKIGRLVELARRAQVTTIVDNLEAASALSRAFEATGMRLRVRIKVDTGLHRCGLPPGQPVLALARKLQDLPGIAFEGITTHAGHIYGAPEAELRLAIGRAEGEEMVRTAELLRSNGIPVGVVSVGSTPSATISGQVKGVTEIRPGNYVFYDAMQVALGVTGEERCALSVRVQVVSTPAPGRALIDGGSKTFCLDQGGHGLGFMKGYGRIVERPDAVLARLSEEHGFLELPQGSPDVPLGSKLTVIPNHACTVVNNFDQMHLVRGEQVLGTWPVAARGRLL